MPNGDEPFAWKTKRCRAKSGYRKAANPTRFANSLARLAAGNWGYL